LGEKDKAKKNNRSKKKMPTIGSPRNNIILCSFGAKKGTAPRMKRVPIGGRISSGGAGIARRKRKRKRKENHYGGGGNKTPSISVPRIR